MHIVDLSHVIFPDMPVYPGTALPVIQTAFCIDKDGFLEKQITFCSHTGTHIDAPAHILEGGKTLDQLPIDRYFGKAFALNVAALNAPCIDIPDLEPYQGALEKCDFLLLHTGWSRLWKTREYFWGYPALTENAAAWLGRFHLKGIGMDAISADKDDSRDFPIHKILLSRDMIVIENLTNLDKLFNCRFTFSCFPLKIEQADGSPVRAAAMIEDDSMNRQKE